MSVPYAVVCVCVCVHVHARTPISQLRGVRAKQIIPAVKTDKKNISSNPKIINDHLKVVHSRLYTPESAACLNDLEAFFSTIAVPAVTVSRLETKP